LDVTERHEQNILIEELLKEKEHQSTTDELTQLPNRRAYNDYMCSLEQSGEPFTIFFIDIDNFKNINDGLAHHVGDLLLKKFSKRISGILERNTRLYRFGGDEIVVVLLGEYDE
jgi:diguanylate cyclase (GGDEF)-like protein